MRGSKISIFPDQPVDLPVLAKVNETGRKDNQFAAIRKGHTRVINTMKTAGRNIYPRLTGTMPFGVSFYFG